MKILFSYQNMSFLSNLLIFFYFSLFTFAHATTFEIQNKCPYTVWAAAVPGGGRRLNNGESWTINLNSSTSSTTTAHFWGRTNCTFDVNGRGNCQTGDCNGLLECTTGYGTPPNTVAEYAQFNNVEFLDISLVDGFNIPMDFSGCRSIKCTADINGQCPDELRVPGGCNSPCNVFQTNEYCCYSGNCGPTNFSRFFKDRCPDAFSLPNDDATPTFSCPLGTNYRIVFCP